MEMIIHVLRATIDKHWNEDDFVILKIDMTNAFNRVSRQMLFNECAEHFPELLPWVRACYSSHPILRHQMGNLTSETGVQQGDPLGPLLFSLVLQKSINEISSSIPLMYNTWYLDDGIVCGQRDSIVQVLHLLRSATSKTGLEVNLSKCEAYSKVDLSILSDDIKKYKQPNLEVLGSPIGDHCFCNEFLIKKISKANELLHALSDLHNPQIALGILRRCSGFCRLIHIARTTPVDQISQSLRIFDNDVRRSLEECTSLECTDDAWQQAQLSLRNGGLGLRSVSQHAGAAYISSFSSASSEPSDYLMKAIHHFNARVLPTEKIQGFDNIRGVKISQHRLSQMIESKSRNDLLQAASPADKARLENVAADHAADWLQVIPSPGLGLALEPNEMSTALKWWLGLRLDGNSNKCIYHPDTILDPHGHHALTCKNGGDIVNRHNTIRNVVYECCSRSLLRPQLERGSGLSNQPKTRPADILLPDWSLGRSAAIDVTVIHPLNLSNLTGASTTVQHITAAAEARKRDVNIEKCRELNWQCLPFCLTAYGAMGDEAMEFVSRLGTRLGTQTGVTVYDAIASICGRISVALVRCNAKAILKRTEASVGRSEILRTLT